MANLQCSVAPESMPGTKNGDVHRQPPNSIYELLRTRAEQNSGAVAIGGVHRPPLTYGGLLNQVESTVGALRGFGVNRNDRVAIVLPNGPAMAVAFAGVGSGATCAPLNPAYRFEEFDFYLSDLNAKALIMDRGLDSPAREVAHKRNIPIIELAAAADAEEGRFTLSGESRTLDIRDGFAQPEDIALVLHTSGTTSRPKIVPLAQANICASGRNVSSTLRLTAEDRCLNVMPLFHIHGLIAAVIASLTAGGNVVCTPGFDADNFFAWLDKFQPTWYTAVPTIHQAVLARASQHRDVISRRPMRFIRSSSASLPRAVMEELENVFQTQVIEAYGMTEAAHQMTSNPLAPSPRKANSVGIAAGPDVAIMDQSGNILPNGATGEVVIRGTNVTSGYENNPSANQSAFIAGWFRTGDQGRFDEDGYLFLTGRLKEIINRGGEKIAPREVDDVLMQHADVAQAVAFAVPHPTLGEEVAAAVVLKPGASATDTEIREFAAAQLADFKVPKEILILDAIPKGATGKLQRIGLADKLAGKLAAKRQGNYVGASSPVENQLAEIWRTLLKVESIGVRDDFRAIGGDSLAMASMLAAVEKRFNVQIPVAGMLRCPTIENLAALIQQNGSAAAEQPTAQPGGTSKPLRDSLLAGFRNRLLQWVALYAPGYKTTRVWLHRMRGVTLGSNVSIGLSAIIETAYPKLVFIGDNVSIGMRAIIIAHLRDSTSAARAQSEATVRIEDDAYIGPGVIILPNVTIGHGAVVSAGSVVTRSIPPKTLVQGNPARAIARCGVSLGGGVSYEEFLRHLLPFKEGEQA